MEELRDAIGDGNDARVIEYAKDWYEANKPEETGFRSARGQERIAVKPAWNNSITMKNDKYEVVDADLMIQGIIRYTNKDCREKYKETGDMKYKQNYIRMVFRTDIETKETDAFLMTLVPNLEWLEKSNFKPFRQANYLNPGKDFGGWILFHNIDGSFSHGLIYENGKQVGSISEIEGDPLEVSLRSTICSWVNYYYEWEQCTDYYSGSEGNYTGYSCYTYWDYAYSLYECYDDGNGGGPSGGGGPSSEPETRYDCPPEAAANGTTTNNVLNSTIGGNAQVKSNIDQLRIYAQTQSNEYGLVINYVNGQYTVNQNSNGSYFNVGYAGSVTNTINVNSYMTAHSHTAGGEGCTAPTPNDAINVAKAYAMGYSNVTGSLIFGYDGSEYMIYVNNPNQLSDFVNDPYSYLNFDNNGDAFMSNPYLSTYNSAFNYLYNSGFSKNDALSYALSYVLDYYNTGLKIYQKKNGDFKEQKTYKDNNSNYLPKICP